jgi:TrmH family RNA methyltransferase
VITSTENSRVKDVLRLRRSGAARRRSGLFVAEGRREVERAAAAGLEIRDVYLAPELIDDWIAPGATGATEVSARVLKHMSYRGEPEGVLAVVGIPDRTLPASPTLVLVAVGIEKPGNLGAMARTADAAGADAILIGDAQVDPWNPNAIRASTGAVFTLPIVATTPDALQELQLQKVAATLGAAIPHTAADLTKPTAILIGAEDAGLPAEWRALAEVEVEIPMHGTATDSLNASAAATVLLFEATRQRGARAPT